MTEVEAELHVAKYLLTAREQSILDFERALRRIAGMSWWERLWRASDVADEALGTGAHWNKGFKEQHQ